MFDKEKEYLLCGVSC